MSDIFIVYVLILIVMSLITFFLYLCDKQRAKKNRWRIRESLLLGFGVLGGAVGAIAAMNIFRHKTKHRYFWVINGCAALVHVALLVFLWLL